MQSQNITSAGNTGDPLHSRAACTQPCNVNTHSRAHCSPGAWLCEQWGQGCVNNGARLCASARLCRGSPVVSQWHNDSSHQQQGKSEGFQSCYRPVVRKRPIWVKIGDVLSRVTLKFDGWPWKTIGHLFFAVSSLVQHFIAIVEFKLELQSGNTQYESNSMIFRTMWPWNLTDDLEKQ